MSVLLHSAGFAQPSLPAHTGSSERRLPPASSGFSKSTGHPLSETRRIQIPVFIMGRPAGHAACFRGACIRKILDPEDSGKTPHESIPQFHHFFLPFQSYGSQGFCASSVRCTFSGIQDSFFPGDPFFKETADGQPLSFAFHDLIIGGEAGTVRIFRNCCRLVQCCVSIGVQRETLGQKIKNDANMAGGYENEDQ